jgi:hypothetical protein
MTLRILGALTLQPFIAAGVVFLAFPFLIDPSVQSSDPADAAIAFAGATGLVGFFVTLCGALPVVAWLHDRRAIMCRDVMLGGLLLGMAPGAVLSLLAFLSNGRSQIDGLIRSGLLGALIGTVSAGTFWLLAHRDLERPPVPAGDDART